MSYNPALLKTLFPLFNPQTHTPTLIKGLTNQNLLFNINDKKILYKILNQDFGQFINRDLERDIMYKVDKHPRVHYADDSTIVRDYIDGYEPLTLNDFNETIIEKFAIELYKFHGTSCTTKSAKLQQITETPAFFNQTRQFLIDHAQLVDTHDLKLYLDILSKFENHRKFFTDFLSNDKDKVVNCHNDINMENILIDKTTGDVVIIDYDYAQPNVLYYEFGNIFTEMNFEYNKTSPYFVYIPDNDAIDAKRKLIVEAYARQLTDCDSRGFFQKCEQYKIFSHLFWINVSFKSIHLGIDLVIPEYVRKRYELYETEFDRYFR